MVICASHKETFCKTRQKLAFVSKNKTKNKTTRYSKKIIQQAERVWQKDGVDCIMENVGSMCLESLKTIRTTRLDISVLLSIFLSCLRVNIIFHSLAPKSCSNVSAGWLSYGYVTAADWGWNVWCEQENTVSAGLSFWPRANWKERGIQIFPQESWEVWTNGLRQWKIKAKVLGVFSCFSATLRRANYPSVTLNSILAVSEAY